MAKHNQMVARWVESMADGLLGNRKLFLTIFVLITLGLGYSAMQIKLDPGFNKQIPVTHPYMENYLHYSETFSGANTILVSVNWKGEGDIYNAEFLDVLRVPLNTLVERVMAGEIPDAKTQIAALKAWKLTEGTR